MASPAAETAWSLRESASPAADSAATSASFECAWATTVSRRAW